MMDLPHLDPKDHEAMLRDALKQGAIALKQAQINVVRLEAAQQALEAELASLTSPKE